VGHRQERREIAERRDITIPDLPENEPSQKKRGGTENEEYPKFYRFFLIHMRDFYNGRSAFLSGATAVKIIDSFFIPSAVAPPAGKATVDVISSPLASSPREVH
jgi:hypothetical protein